MVKLIFWYWLLVTGFWFLAVDTRCPDRIVQRVTYSVKSDVSKCRRQAANCQLPAPSSKKPDTDLNFI